MKQHQINLAFELEHLSNEGVHNIRDHVISDGHNVYVKSYARGGTVWNRATVLCTRYSNGVRLFQVRLVTFSSEGLPLEKWVAENDTYPIYQLDERDRIYAYWMCPGEIKRRWLPGIVNGYTTRISKWANKTGGTRHYHVQFDCGGEDEKLHEIFVLPYDIFMFSMQISVNHDDSSDKITKGNPLAKPSSESLLSLNQVSIDAKGPFERELLSVIQWRQNQNQKHLEAVSFPDMEFPGNSEDEASLTSFPISFPASRNLAPCVLNGNCCIKKRVLHPFELDIGRSICANQIQDFTTELLSEDKENYLEKKMILGFEKNKFEINQADLNTSSVSLILHSSIRSQAATASSKKEEKCPIPASKSEETFTEFCNKKSALNSPENKVDKVKQDKSIKRNLPLKKRRIRLAFEEIDLNVVAVKSPQKTRDKKASKAICKFAYI